MKSGKYLGIVFFTLIMMKGLSNNGEIQCTERVTWSGSAKTGFYSSYERDSHIRELYFKPEAGPTDICTEAELKVTFRITPADGNKIPDISKIEGKVLWGDQEMIASICFSETDHAYTGVIEGLDLKPYFDEFPTLKGTGAVNVIFKWYNLTIGTEQDDVQYVLDNISDMHVDIEYARK